MERGAQEVDERETRNGKCVSVERTERNIAALLPSARALVGLGIEHLFEMSKSEVGLCRRRTALQHCQPLGQMPDVVT